MKKLVIFMQPNETHKQSKKYIETQEKQNVLMKANGKLNHEQSYVNIILDDSLQITFCIVNLSLIDFTAPN